LMSSTISALKQVGLTSSTLNLGGGGGGGGITANELAVQMNAMARTITYIGGVSISLLAVLVVLKLYH